MGTAVDMLSQIPRDLQERVEEELDAGERIHESNK